jgi:hypothetical protein
VNFVIQSEFLGILKKLLCYHENYFKYFTFGKYNGFVGEGFCMHVFSSISNDVYVEPKTQEIVISNILMKFTVL